MAFLYIGILCGLEHLRVELSVFGGKILPSLGSWYHSVLLFYVIDFHVFPGLSLLPSRLVTGFTFVFAPVPVQCWDIIRLKN